MYVNAVTHGRNCRQELANITHTLHDTSRTRKDIDPMTLCAFTIHLAFRHYLGARCDGSRFVGHLTPEPGKGEMSFYVRYFNRCNACTLDLHFFAGRHTDTEDIQGNTMSDM